MEGGCGRRRRGRHSTERASKGEEGEKGNSLAVRKKFRAREKERER